jgi:dihydrofolate reductase|tara:strand:+ start:2048 stop:2521 length:474 start_codon:yes stop_codon:yes gene_type:complete
VSKPICKAIVAVSQNGVIGKNGDLPWRLSGDLKWFRKITMGHTLIMGRKTWDSLPGALPGRENWVLSRSMKPTEGIRVFNNFDRVLENASGKTLFVIGGGELYRQTLSYCKEIFVTEVLRTVEGGDAFFPPFEHQYDAVEVLDENDEFILRRWVAKN